MEVAGDTSHGTVGAGLRPLCQVHTVEPSHLPDFRVYKNSIERKRQVPAWTLAQDSVVLQGQTLRKGSSYTLSWEAGMRLMWESAHLTVIRRWLWSLAPHKPDMVNSGSQQKLQSLWLSLATQWVHLYFMIHCLNNKNVFSILYMSQWLLLRYLIIWEA